MTKADKNESKIAKLRAHMNKMVDLQTQLKAQYDQDVEMLQEEHAQELANLKAEITESIHKQWSLESII